MEQIKLFPKYLGSMLLRIVICILIGTLLLSAVFLLPAEPMDRNLGKSAPIFAEEGVYPTLYSWCTSQLDSTTDALILMISACNTGESPLVQAMSGCRNTVTNDDEDDPMKAHYEKGMPFDDYVPYYQYWHGYQLIVRPLLSVLDYQGIRLLNGILQSGLFIVMCILLHKSGLTRCILPYAVSVAMLMPVALAMSLQFSSSYYILMLGSFAVLWMRSSLDRIDGILFLYIGIATAFFDFLTYPIATLGIPAVLYFCIREKTSLRDIFCRGVKICFSWGIGYVVMWAGKWMVGSLILRKNLLSIAGDKVSERAALDSVGNELLKSMRTALSANIRAFLDTPATLALLILAGVLLFLLCRTRSQQKKSISSVTVVLFPYVILALLPIAWYLVTSQHATVHFWFTNKSLVVSAFAGLTGLADGLHFLKTSN